MDWSAFGITRHLDYCISLFQLFQLFVLFLQDFLVVDRRVSPTALQPEKTNLFALRINDPPGLAFRFQFDELLLNSRLLDRVRRSD